MVSERQEKLPIQFELIARKSVSLYCPKVYAATQRGAARSAAGRNEAN